MRDENGRFTEGNPGRPKGSKNKTTEAWNQLRKDMLETHTEHLIEALNRLRKDDPKAYIEAVNKLLCFFKPKLKAVEYQRTDEAFLDFRIEDVIKLRES